MREGCIVKPLSKETRGSFCVALLLKCVLKFRPLSLIVTEAQVQHNKEEEKKYYKTKEEKERKQNLSLAV
jgi:hypoxanthine phosphoribosyltransferase